MTYLPDTLRNLVRSPSRMQTRSGRQGASSWRAVWRTSLRDARLVVLGGIALGLGVAVVQEKGISLPGITLPHVLTDAVRGMPSDTVRGRDDAAGDARAGTGVAAGRGGTIERSAPGARFTICGHARRIDCVVDGDTFWMAGTKIRIADIDTPETHPPRCAAEARAGEAATLRMQDLLNAGPFTLVPIKRDVDRYGRKLRVVERDGESLGDVLVQQGLARRYGGGKRAPWCGLG
jgi:endonuclease YncB( thermonuclease family)